MQGYLTLASGNCDMCGDEFSGETDQEANVRCKKCGKSLRACGWCREKGCPSCGGELWSQADQAGEDGWLL